MGSYQLRGLGLWRWEEDMDSLSSSLDKGTGFFREDSSICPALLSKQAFQAHHLVPKLGDNLREVVECNHCFFHLRTRLFCKAWRKGLE